MRRFSARGGWWVIAQGVLLVGAAAALLFWDGGLPDEGAGRALTVAAGLVGLASGLALVISGLQTLGAHVTPFPAPRDDGRLVEHGPYRLVRHPLYGGVFLSVVGAALLGSSLPALVIGALLLPFFYGKSAFEERHLEAAYPGYAAYRLRVKRRLVPWVL